MDFDVMVNILHGQETGTFFTVLNNHKVMRHRRVLVKRADGMWELFEEATVSNPLSSFQAEELAYDHRWDQWSLS